jgi:hypothetical protein
MNKRFLTVTVALSVIFGFLAVAYFLFNFESTQAQSGWLSDYGYRKQITINGSTAGSQTNYQMKLTVNRGTGSDSGGTVYLNDNALDWPNDIRFTKSDGTSALDYWLEKSDANTATVWIEFDSLPASPTTANFYIYYGKTGAGSASSGDNTFIFFDDFAGTTIDSGKWTKVDTGSNISQNEVLTIANGTGAWGGTAMYSNTNFNRSDNLLVQGKYKSTAVRGATYKDTTMVWTKNSTTGVNSTDMIYGLYFYDSLGTIFDTWNIYGVSNGAARSGNWTITEPRLIAELMTYHWNGGSGTAAGTMHIRKSSDSSIVWQGAATTSSPNTYHYAYPNVVLPADTYYVTYTAAAWSYNTQSGGVNSGFLRVRATTNILKMYEDGTDRGSITPAWQTNTQYWVRQIIKSGGGATTQWSTDGDSWTTKYDSAYSTATPIKIGFTHYQGGDVIIDDVLVRKYVSPEPGWGAWGEEEESSPLVSCQAHDVWGWAWSDNIGPISFSCENETEIGTGADYGIDIEEETGNLSGYAWSGSVGWIDFTPAGPYPDTPNYPAKVDLQSGEVSGWIKVLNPGDTWDGWIKLGGE